jgi:hypothetical protein
MKTEGTLIEITWQDAWSNDEGWEDCALADLCATSAINKTVGYVVHESKRQIVLAQSVHAEGERFCTLTGIPVGCILKIRKIKRG